MSDLVARGLHRMLRDSSGLCLAEMMIAMTAGAVILAATLESVHHFQRRLEDQQSILLLQQDLRLGMRVMEAELRLAGSGGPPSGAPLLRAAPQAFEFLANLEGYATALTQAASHHQRELFVADGTDWPKGKRVWVCGEQGCLENRLARNGLEGVLVLTDPLGRAFPAGSAVFVSNQVRYYLGKDQTGRASLMRQVDGGANALVGGVTWLQVVYLDGRGFRTEDPALVARIHLELKIEGHRRALTYEVGLRGR